MTALVVASALAVLYAMPASASAAPCGYKDTPKCVEAPPPGQVYEPPNQHGMQPVTTPPANQALYPQVNGHLPFGFNAQANGNNPAQGMTFEEEASIGDTLGGSMVRIGVDWAIVRGDPAHWNYDRVDEQYAAAIARNMRPILTVAKAPRRFTRFHNACWTVAPLSGCLGPTNTAPCEGEGCWIPPTSDTVASTTTPRTGLDWWRIFVKDVATRYPLAGGIEIWNEPNHPTYWDPPGNGQSDPSYYTWLLSLSDGAVSEAGRNFPVLGGALANGGDPAVIPVRAYVEQMLDAGAAQYMDALSIHPYLGGQASTEHLESALVDNTQAVEDAYDAAAVSMNERLVATEVGMPLAYGGIPQFNQTEQSYWVRRQFQAYDTPDPDVPLSDRIDAVFWHAAVDGNPDSFGWLDHRDGTGKFKTRTVFCDFGQEFGQLQSCPTYVP